MQDEVFRLCAEMCNVRSDFAEWLFPYLIHDMLLNDSDSSNKKSRARVCNGLRKWITALLEEPNKPHTDCVRLILTTLNYLHKIVNNLQKERSAAAGSKAERFWKLNFWEDINYLVVARAAFRVGAQCTALLYTELWCERTNYTLSKVEDTESQSESSKNSKGPRMLLLDIFTSIGEPDALYGLNLAFDSTAPQIAAYVHEGNWPKALYTYDVLLHHIPTSSGTNRSGQLPYHIGLLDTMQNLGHYHILDYYLRGFSATYQEHCPQLSEFQHQMAWRSGIWSPISSNGVYAFQKISLLTYRVVIEANRGSPGGFHAAIHTSLLALASRDEERFRTTIQHARIAVLRDANVGFDNYQSAAPLLLRLGMLADIDRAWSDEVRWNLAVGRDVDFASIEPMITLRIALASALLRPDMVRSQLAVLVTASRKANRFAVASHATYRLKALDANSRILPSTRLEEAKVLWDQGEWAKALSIGWVLLNSTHNQRDKVRADIKHQLGKWLAQTRTERSHVVEECLHDAVELYKEFGEQTAMGKAHFTLACYVDGLYQGLHTKKASSEWAATMELRQHKEKELEMCEKLLAKSGSDKAAQAEIGKHVLSLRRIVAADKQDSARLQGDLEAALLRAIESYCDALMYTNNHDIRAMFRVCSLWFLNTSVPKVNTLVKEKFSKMPTGKFLPLIYQMASRLTAAPSAFQGVLTMVIERAANAHPHQTLYQLFALRNSDTIHHAQKGKSRYVVDKESEGSHRYDPATEAGEAPLVS